MGDLLALKKLFLEDNQISGTIPTSFGRLTELTCDFPPAPHPPRPPLELLPLSAPHLTRSADQLFSELDLSGNKLSGTIPKEFRNLKYMQHLCLSGNQLEGELPKFLSKLSPMNPNCHAWAYDHEEVG